MKDRDQKHIWHPYTQHGLNPDILPVTSARGASLELADGRKIIDAVSSWWVNIHGHGHPSLVKAIADQAASLDHVIFAGFTHEPGVRLAEVLLKQTSLRNLRFDRVFYSDNGSTSVEVALKMAYQFQQNIGQTTRTKFIALHDSYHGDTLGAMAVGEPDGFHGIFQKLFPKVDFVNVNRIEELNALVEKNPEAYAAFIFEPMVQGASGMKFQDANYLKSAVELCQKYKILTIADEVFTGFYRTGKCFASEHAGISPDLLCLSKGITGGTLPLAVTLATREIFEGFKSTEIKSAFLHGHSYTANPIACAAALASWALLESEACQNQIKNISAITEKRISKLRNHPKVKEARNLGTIGAVELKSDTNYFSANPKNISKMAIDRGVLLRPLGNVLYAVPPYCTSVSELNQVYSVMEEIIDEL